MFVTGRAAFRHRLDRLTERLPAEPILASECRVDFAAMSMEELDAYLAMRSRPSADEPEDRELHDKLSQMTGQELDEYIRMFSIHPSQRGNWKP